MAKDKCRLQYIEPTDIGNGKNNGYTSPLEDYSLYVNLTIVKNDRYNCGMVENEEMQYSSSNGSISFLHGTSGILTTNFTDINMSHNDSNTSECLGIKSIKIEFNSWVCPHINIVFTDVRGASLMGRDESYYNKSSKTASFFNEMFKFPYPMFKLSIKGFYGKCATYYLALENILMPFDASVGNFEVTANFIGYLFGPFNDIPLSFATVAPYVSIYGKNYWEEQVSNGSFAFTNGAPMFKFTELRKKVSSAASTEESKRIERRHNDSTSLLNNKKNKLESILSKNPFQDDWIEPEDGLIIFKLSEKNDKSQINKEISEFLEEIKRYDEEYTDNLYSSFKFIADSFIEVVRCTLDTVKNAYVYKPSKYKEIVSEKNVLSSRLNLESTKISKYFIYFLNKNERINFSDKITEIKKEIEKISQEIEMEDREYINSKEQAILNALDFSPTIKNFYSLLFAHISTFAHLMYTVMSEIKSEIDNNKEIRLPSHYGINISDTDINKDSGKKYLPPFFAVYKEENGNGEGKRELLWPGNLTNGSDLKEVELVKEFLKAGKIFTKQQSFIEKLESKDEDLNDDASLFIPLTTYDFINNFKYDNKNPYFSIENMGDGVDISFLLSILLATRIFYFLLGNESLSSKEKAYFGTIDAINAYKAFYNGNKNSFKNFYNEYAASPNRGVQKIINLICSSNNMNFSSTSPFLKDGNVIIYRWVTYNNDYYLPCGTSNILQIKNDVATKNISENRNFIDISNISSGNVENFYISENRNLLVDFYDNLSQYNFGEQEELMIYKENRIEQLLRQKESQNIEGKAYDNILFGIYKNANTYSFDVSEIMNGIEQAIKNGITDNVIIRYSSCVDDTPFYSLYGCPLYWLQENNEDLEAQIMAKAYLFLFSIPFMRYKENVGITTSCFNGQEFKISLLREGALYWRESNILHNGSESRDGFIYNGNIPEALFGKKVDKRNFNYKIPKVNEVCIAKGSKYNVLSPCNITDNSDYKSYIEPEGITIDRKKKLIEFFTNWALKEYISIDKLLKDKDVYFNLENIKIKNGKIKGLEIDFYSSKKNAIDSKSKKCYEIQDYLKNLYFNIYYIMDSTNKIKSNNNKVNLNDFSSIILSFLSEIKTLYESKSSDFMENSDDIIDEDFALSIYMALKKIYDKWFCCNLFKKWEYNNIDSIFNKFIYLDVFYHEIGDKLITNASKVSDLLSKYLPSSNNFGNYELNTYNYLENVANICQGNLMVVPFTYVDRKENDLESVFKAYSISSSNDDDNLTFVFLYSYKVSENLSDKNGYKNDGMDINDEETCKSIMDENGLNIPAFGVTFAKQNQAFFKNIKLNMNSSQNTDIGIMAAFDIQSKAIEGPRNTVLYGQDIYNIYASNSYECIVEMMGDAQIMPLMYFQLNGIPMWNGIYLIISVSHEIGAGEMKTIFKGIKLSRNSIPFASPKTLTIKDTSISEYSKNDIVNSKRNRINNAYGTDEAAAYEVWNYVFNVLNLEDKGKCAKYVYQLAMGFTGNEVVYGNGKNSTKAGGNANQEGFWNNLRKIGYSLVLDKIYDAPSNQMEDEINKINIKSGDVLVYYATESDNKKDSAYLYGHTQFYVNEEVGWVSSVKNNYIGPLGAFVYNNKSGCRKWRVLHFKSPSAGLLKI